MGHIRLGTLPKTRKWEHVVGLIAGGADVERIAAASADAAEHGLERASQDQGLGQGLKTYDPGTPRDRVLSAEEIEALWKWLETGALPPADILKLQLATGARCGEISGLCAEEIDRERWTRALPAARSKNKRPRVTPLVGIARQNVEGRLSAVQSGPFFIAETGTPFMAAHVGHYLLARRDKLPISKFTTHDLRRIVATML